MEIRKITEIREAVRPECSFFSLCHSRRRFDSVNISRRSHEKVDFKFGFSIESYAKIQNFLVNRSCEIVFMVI